MTLNDIKVINLPKIIDERDNLSFIEGENTEQIHQQVLSLPISQVIDQDDVKYIFEKLGSWKTNFKIVQIN
jgi:dTDP-4-amino-4,6-dideoxygalactose transaminase